MSLARISDKGQITLPAHMRRQLGLNAKSQVELEIRDDEVVIRPIKSIVELCGIFKNYAKGKSQDWETIRTQTEQAVAEEVANEDRR